MSAWEGSRGGLSDNICSGDIKVKKSGGGVY